MNGFARQTPLVTKVGQRALYSGGIPIPDFPLPCGHSPAVESCTYCNPRARHVIYHLGHHA